VNPSWNDQRSVYETPQGALKKLAKKKGDPKIAPCVLPFREA